MKPSHLLVEPPLIHSYDKFVILPLFQHHFLRHHLQELRREEHLGQLADDAQVRHEGDNAIKLFISSNLHK